MDGTTRTVDKMTPNRLISADRVEGTAVYNRKGEKLGSIENVMIDKYSGHVAYAIMSFGGFLGIGDKQHPLPWSVLDYVPDQGGYVVDLDRDQLMKAPQIDAHDTV
ncbi:MAG: PRC-barrel domain-containing protein, partial [Rhodospirillales bacterium]